MSLALARRGALAAAVVTAALAVAFVAPRALADAPPAAGGGGAFKDLQVLPKTISRPELKAIMKAQAKALGVDCDHCHEMPDPWKPTKNKETARAMMRMVEEVNGKFLKGMDQKVTCNTCHRGKEKPEKG